MTKLNFSKFVKTISNTHSPSYLNASIEVFRKNKQNNMIKEAVFDYLIRVINESDEVDKVTLIEIYKNFIDILFCDSEAESGDFRSYLISLQSSFRDSSLIDRNSYISEYLFLLSLFPSNQIILSEFLDKDLPILKMKDFQKIEVYKFYNEDVLSEYLKYKYKSKNKNELHKIKKVAKRLTSYYLKEHNDIKNKNPECAKKIKNLFQILRTYFNHNKFNYNLLSSFKNFTVFLENKTLKSQLNSLISGFKHSKFSKCNIEIFKKIFICKNLREKFEEDSNIKELNPTKIKGVKSLLINTLAHYIENLPFNSTYNIKLHLNYSLGISLPSDEKKLFSPLFLRFYHRKIYFEVLKSSNKKIRMKINSVLSIKEFSKSFLFFQTAFLDRTIFLDQKIVLMKLNLNELCKRIERRENKNSYLINNSHFMRNYLNYQNSIYAHKICFKNVSMHENLEQIFQINNFGVYLILFLFLKSKEVRLSIQNNIVTKISTNLEDKIEENECVLRLNSSVFEILELKPNFKFSDKLLENLKLTFSRITVNPHDIFNCIVNEIIDCINIQDVNNVECLILLQKQLVCFSLLKSFLLNEKKYFEAEIKINLGDLGKFEKICAKSTKKVLKFEENEFLAIERSRNYFSNKLDDILILYISNDNFAAKNDEKLILDYKKTSFHLYKLVLTLISKNYVIPSSLLLFEIFFSQGTNLYFLSVLENNFSINILENFLGELSDNCLCNVVLAILGKEFFNFNEIMAEDNKNDTRIDLIKKKLFERKFDKNFIKENTENINEIAIKMLLELKNRGYCNIEKIFSIYSEIFENIEDILSNEIYDL